MKPKNAENLCEFYPTEEDIEEDGPFCYGGSDVSGGPPCSKEYGETCQWAIEGRRFKDEAKNNER